MKKTDFVIFAVIIVAAAVLYFSGILRPGESGAYAVVYVDGEERESYRLSEDTSAVINGINGTNELVIKDGKAEIVSADCPDKVCVNHVPVYRENESIICLPHKVVIEIHGGSENKVDVISQ